MGKTTFSGPIRTAVGWEDRTGSDNLEGVCTVGQFMREVFTNPLADSATSFVNAKALPASSETWTPGVTSGVIAYALDYPQTLVFACSGVQTGNIVINGKDVFGRTIQETLALNGTSSVYSTKAFASVTSFVVPAKTASETINIGNQNVGTSGGFGLKAPVAKLLSEITKVAGVETEQGPTSTIKLGDPSATPTSGGDPYGLFRPYTTIQPNGATTYTIYYMADMSRKPY